MGNSKAMTMFTNARQVPQRGTEHQTFYRVTMSKQVAPEDLLGMGFEPGKIHGVESTKSQDPLQPGDEVVVMVWSETAPRFNHRSAS